MSPTRIVFAAAFVVIASSCSNSSSPDLQQRASSVDSAFVTGAGQSSNAEISAAQLAMTKSTNADVLSFAKEMIADHGQENAALAPAARQVGLTPPAGVNPTQAAEAQKLMTLAGSAFDAEYVNSEVNGHQLNLNNNYEPEVSSGGAPVIVGYAQKYEPQIEMHLSMIQAIKSKYGF